MANGLMALLISGGVIFFIWLLKGCMLTPVPVSRDQKLTAVLRVSGNAWELEQTVKGLLWLIHNGTLPMSVLIADGGLDPEARAAAAALAKENPQVRFCGMDEIKELI